MHSDYCFACQTWRRKNSKTLAFRGVGQGLVASRHQGRLARVDEGHGHTKMPKFWGLRFRNRWSNFFRRHKSKRISGLEEDSNQTWQTSGSREVIKKPEAWRSSQNNLVIIIGYWLKSQNRVQNYQKNSCSKNEESIFIVVEFSLGIKGT